jgi:purine-binding chemotaxis protein CheW
MITASEHNSGAIGSMPVDRGLVDRRRLLVIRTGANLCAVPLDNVIEVMRALPVSPVTNGPGYVRGLSIVRGDAIAVVDVGLLIGGTATDCRRLVTVRTGERVIALAASDVLGVQDLAADGLKELPPLLQRAGNEAIAAISAVDAQFLFLLQATRVIPPELLDRVVADGVEP